jgi:hypothetical protein
MDLQLSFGLVAGVDAVLRPRPLLVHLDQATTASKGESELAMRQLQQPTHRTGNLAILDLSANRYPVGLATVLRASNYTKAEPV